MVRTLPAPDSLLLSPQDATMPQQGSAELACYCPFGFDTLHYSGTCKPATLDILWHIHEIVKITHMETPTRQHRIVKTELIKVHGDWLRQLPSVRSPDSPHHNDSTYECCRLTALLQMSMVEDRVRMDTTQLVMHLKEALKKTDLANCWDNMVGVFLWILMSKSGGHLRTCVALTASLVAIPMSHDTSHAIFFHIQSARLFECICYPPTFQYHTAVRSTREYFRFREACRLGRG